MLTAAGNTARLWELTTGRPLTEELAHDGVVRSARFSPDGTLVVTTSADKTARLWDAATGLPVSERLRHEQAVLNAFFTPDGREVLTISEDGTARMWHVPGATGSIPEWLPELAEAVGGLRFNSQRVLETVPTESFPRLRAGLMSLSSNDGWVRWAQSFCTESKAIDTVEHSRTERLP